MKKAVALALAVLPGMELQTREEVHVLCLFDDEAQLEEWQKLVDPTLPAIENDPEHFGEQFVVDETGEFIRRINATFIGPLQVLQMSEAWKLDQRIGRIDVIIEHVNRTAFGVIANLGLYSTDIGQVEMMEISRHIQPAQARKNFSPNRWLSFDPKRRTSTGLDEFLGTTILEITVPTINELRMAFANQNGRTCQIVHGQTDGQ